MPIYRIHRMKDPARESFRWAPHVSAEAIVKPKDYESVGDVEAQSEYDAWMALRTSERPIGIGDLLETEGGELRICKYVGWEAAKWWAPEPAAEPVTASEPK